MISKKNALINILFRSSNILYLIALGILLVPMYLKFIPVELYGYWLASGNVISWLGDLQSVSAVMQQRTGLSFGARDFATIGKYIGTSLLISLMLVSLLFFVLLVFYYFIFGWLGIDDAGYRAKLSAALIYAAIGLLLTLFSFGFSGINYGLQLFKPVGLLSLCTNLTCIAVTYLLLPGYSILAFGLALLVRGALDITGNAIILWSFMKRNNIRISFSRSTTKSLLGDVSFNFFSRIGNLLSKNSQLFFIARFVAPESAVIFKVTKTIPEISRYFITVPAEAMMPVLSSYVGQRPSQEQLKATISKMIYYSIWAAGIVFTGFVLLNEGFINLWVGKQFFSGNPTNITIVGWVVVSLLTTNLMYTVFALGDLRKNNLVQFCQSVLFVVLMIVMIKPWGTIGIAVALLLSEAVISLVYYPRSLQRYLHFTRKEVGSFLREFIAVAIASLLLFVLFRQFNLMPSSWAALIGWIGGCGIAYIVSLYLLSPAFRKEMAGMLTRISFRFSKRNAF